MIPTPGRRRRRTAALSASVLLASALAAPAAFAADPVSTAGTDDVATQVRYAGDDRFGTSQAFATAGYGVATAAVVTTGANFPDALAGAYLSGTAGGPVLLTRADRLPPDTAAALTALAAGDDFATVYVLGGPNAVSDDVVDAIEAITGAGSVTRVEGADRYATAIAIANVVPGTGTAAEQVGTTSGANGAVRTAILATGQDYADALVAGPASRAGSLPILLTRTDALNPETKQALVDLGIERVIIAGGDAAVSDTVRNELAETYEVLRLSGATRNETAVAFADFNDRQFPGFGPGQAGLALGWGEGKFADALSMAPLAGRDTFSILLTRTDALPTGTADAPSTAEALAAREAERATLVVAGGPAAVSAPVSLLAADLLEKDGTITQGTVFEALATGDAGGPDSLRAQIRAANDNPGADTILLKPGATYTLGATGDDEDAAATGDLDITDDLLILGGGATINGAALGDRILEVLGAEVSIADVTLTGGAVRDDDGLLGLGGALRLDAGSDVTVTNVVFSDNTASKAGGAIENSGGTLTVTDTDFVGNTAAGGVVAQAANGGAIHATGNTAITGGTASDNTAALEGGAFWVGGDATMTVAGTVFEGNVAAGDGADNGGGALYNDGASLAVSGATINGNAATGAAGSGGGILSNGGTLVVTDSTVNNNTANRAGGGIELALAVDADTPSATLLNVDFDSNSAGTAPGNGGALHAGGGDVEITGGNVTDNAAQEGGGFWNGAGTMRVDGTVFTGNQANGAFTGDDPSTPDVDETEVQGGGALFVTGGELVVANARIEDNTATTGSGSGGAVVVDGGTLRLDDSLVSGNSANRAGGAIELWGRTIDTASAGVVLVNRTVLRGNAAVGGSDADGATDGPGNGGVLHVTGPGNATFVDSVLDGNAAAKEGGAIWNGTEVTSVVDSTISANTAIVGGGIFNDGATGTIEVLNATISGNTLGASSATTTASGSQVVNSGKGIAVFFSTIVDGAASPAGSVVNVPDAAITLATPSAPLVRFGSSVVDGTCAGVFDTFNNNVVTSASCVTTPKNRDMVVADALLGDLADNGGPQAGLTGATEPILTHLAEAGSATIDNGTSGSLTLFGRTLVGPTVDQRGLARGNDGDGNTVAAKDTGATEFGAA